MSKSSKVSEERDHNENSHIITSSSRKSLRRQWLKLGMDRREIQSECSRVFSQIQKLANTTSEMSAEGNYANETANELTQSRTANDDLAKFSIEKYTLDTDGNFRIVGIDSPHNNTGPATDRKSTTAVILDINMNDITLVDNNVNEIIRRIPSGRSARIAKSPRDSERKKDTKESIEIPQLAQKAQGSSIRKYTNSQICQTSSNSVASVSNKPKLSSQATNHQIKQRTSRPIVEVFERKLSSKSVRDKSPYSYLVSGQENETTTQTSKLSVSFRNYNLLRTMSKNSVNDNESSKSRHFMTCSNDIIPLWSLDINDKSNLPYPRASTSSQYTQTKSSGALIDVSQSTSNCLLAGEYSQCSLQDIIKDMKESIYAATEAGHSLINTVFKNDLGNPNATAALTEIPEFIDFINSDNEIEVLDKIANIYDLAIKRVQSFKQRLLSDMTDQLIFPPNVRFSKNISKILHISSQDTENKEADKLSRAYPMWTFDYENSQKFELSLTSDAGELDQTIIYNNRSYQTKFKGTPNNANVLSRAICQNSIPTQLKPHLILEVTERTSSYANSRVVAAKYCCTQVVNRLCPVAQYFLDGKYFKLPKKGNLSKTQTKIKQINVASGIVLQLSHDFLCACKTIHKVFGKQMGFESILSRNDIPGIFDEDNVNMNIPISAKIETTDSIQFLQNAIKEISATLEVGELALSLLQEDTKRPLKRHFGTTIKLLLNGIRQLASIQCMDFGTLIITLSCNTSLVQNLTEIIPSIVDKTTRYKIIANITQIHWGIGQLIQSVQSVNTIAAYISEHSLSMIWLINSELKKQKKSNCLSIFKDKSQPK